MRPALSLHHVGGSMQACTCSNHDTCQADDAVLPTMSCGSPPSPSACPASVQDKDQNRVRGMRIMLERQTRAAGAAASADTADAAKAAAEAQLLPPQAAASSPEEAAQEVGAGAAASSSAFAGDLSCSSLHPTPERIINVHLTGAHCLPAAQRCLSMWSCSRPPLGSRRHRCIC